MTNGKLKRATEVTSATNSLIRRTFGLGEDEKRSPVLEEDHPKASAHFVKVGTFGCGAIFGLGEEMQDRAIVAASSGAQCLMVPRYWLLTKQQNVGNIWNRTKIYLNQTIPSRQKVFEEYVRSKKWKKQKEAMTRKIMSVKPKIVSTQQSDVPIMCRIDHFY